MIKLIIGGVNVGASVDKYGVDYPTVKGNNSMATYSGEQVEDTLGRRIVLSIGLGDVPNAIATSLMAAINSESIAVTYSAPMPVQNTFKCTSSSIDVSDSTPDEVIDTNTTWDITLTLESTSLVTQGNGL